MADKKPICDNNETTVEESPPEEDGEMVDPHQKLRDACKARPDCAAMFEKLTTCNDRVNSRTKTSEVCAEEMIDFVQCVDHCAAKKLFNFLK